MRVIEYARGKPQVWAVPSAMIGDTVRQAAPTASALLHRSKIGNSASAILLARPARRLDEPAIYLGVFLLSLLCAAIGPAVAVVIFVFMINN